MKQNSERRLPPKLYLKASLGRGIDDALNPLGNRTHPFLNQTGWLRDEILSSFPLSRNPSRSVRVTGLVVACKNKRYMLDFVDESESG